eukprot:TRINITY_DN937_c0_g1_i2.p1 TRINITY_DN937_c0_g1~~TRINITY_DN937_c0_g1_i2.p1  ORF type:complete len:213 (-),score=47.71 TRINITY_DN937_c0_g1_i2:1185-1823(-)
MERSNSLGSDHLKQRPDEEKVLRRLKSSSLLDEKVQKHGRKSGGIPSAVDEENEQLSRSTKHTQKVEVAASHKSAQPRPKDGVATMFQPLPQDDPEEPEGPQLPLASKEEQILAKIAEINDKIAKLEAKKAAYVARLMHSRSKAREVSGPIQWKDGQRSPHSGPVKHGWEGEKSLSRSYSGRRTPAEEARKGGEGRGWTTKGTSEEQDTHSD